MSFPRLLWRLSHEYKSVCRRLEAFGRLCDPVRFTEESRQNGIGMMGHREKHLCYLME